MKRLVFATAAAVLLSSSFAAADNPLIPNDNDQMQALNTSIERGLQIVSSSSQVRNYTAAMPSTTAWPVSLGFLLHSGDTDAKLVENQYAR